MENQELELFCKVLISAKREKQEAMLLEVKEPKNEPEDGGISVPGRNKESIQTLLRELTEAEQELEYLKQQLQPQHHWRPQLETEKLEAVETTGTSWKQFGPLFGLCSVFTEQFHQAQRLFKVLGRLKGF